MVFFATSAPICGVVYSVYYAYVSSQHPNFFYFLKEFVLFWKLRSA